MDARTDVLSIILVVATLLLLLLLLVFTRTVLVTVWRLARAGHRQNFTRSDGLARALNNPLARILTFLSERPLQVTTDEGICSHVRGLLDAPERVTSLTHNMLQMLLLCVAGLLLFGALTAADVVP